MPTPAVVQSAISGGAATSLAFASNVAAGNLLVAAMGVLSLGTLPALTVTDSRGNTWTLAASQSGSDCEWIYWAVANSSGALTITVFGTGFGTAGPYNSSIALAEVSGGLTGAIDTTGAQPSSYPLTLTHANDVVFTAAFEHSSAVSGSVTSPEILLEENTVLALAWYLAPPSGSFASSLVQPGAYNLSVAFTSGAPLAIGAKGATQCSGSIARVNLGAVAGGVTRCWGSAHAVINAIATAGGVTHCWGTVSQLELFAPARGVVKCAGAATSPLKGSAVSCLQPPASSTSHPAGAQPVNAVY
jgi:hypothetical protein